MGTGNQLTAATAPGRVQELINTYHHTHRADDPDVSWSVLADLVADILHYADAHRMDGSQVLRVATSHYVEEHADQLHTHPHQESR